jgi:hypothetical protein
MALAYIPPMMSPEEAIKGGRVAFVGRVVRLEEIKRGGSITAEARLEVLECYYGIDCGEAKYVNMQYICETVVHAMNSVPLHISDKYLIVLNIPIAGNEISFNSDDSYRAEGRPLDFIYRIDDVFPKDLLEKETMVLEYQYFGSDPYNVKKSDFEKWANERSRGLEAEE